MKFVLFSCVLFCILFPIVIFLAIDFLIFLFKGIDVRGSIFADMENHFTNLKNIQLQGDGFYGSISRQTFTGLKKIEIISIYKTSIDNIENGSFELLNKLKGKTKYLIFNKYCAICSNYTGLFGTKTMLDLQRIFSIQESQYSETEN